MEQKLEGIKRYTFDELKEEMVEADALFMGTAAFVLGTTWIDFQRLKKKLEEMPEFRVVFRTFSTSHLRIVKVDQFEKYLAWRRERDKQEIGG